MKKQKANLPVVILTAYDEVNKAKDAVSNGANAFFVKGREQGLVELIQKETKKKLGIDLVPEIIYLGEF